MNNLIPLSQATEMTARYRAEKENILVDAYKGKKLLSICETFNRAAFDQTLALPDCV